MNPRLRAPLLAGASLLLCVVGGPAASGGERESGVSERGAAPTHFLSLTPAAFVPMDPDHEYAMTTVNLTATSQFSSVDFLASVQLPQGAQIQQMRVIFVDQSLAGPLSVSLQRTTGAAVTTLVSLPNTVDAPGVQTVDVNLSHIVDNEANGYQIRAAWTAPPAPLELQLRLVRIGYTMPSAIACDGDINGDSRVDGADLSVLLARFGTVCGP